LEVPKAGQSGVIGGQVKVNKNKVSQCENWNVAKRQYQKEIGRLNDKNSKNNNSNKYFIDFKARLLLSASPGCCV
jgi:hypothetical protein